jgi:hypothetical protein
METGIVAALGSVVVLLGYAIIKKISRSRCHSDSGCIQCDTPAIDIARENTKRLDSIADLIMQLNPKEDPIFPVSLEVKAAHTISGATI